MWPSVRAVVVLGGFAWANLWPGLRMAGVSVPDRVPPFAHGLEVPSGWAHGARLLSRQSAEHVHRTADRADARRRARPRGACWRVAWLRWRSDGAGDRRRRPLTALGWAAAIAAIRAAVVSDAATGVPPRTVVDVRAGQLLVMAGRRSTGTPASRWSRLLRTIRRTGSLACRVRTYSSMRRRCRLRPFSTASR